MCFSQNYAGTDSVYKNHARKLKFGLEVPLYGLYKPLEQIFEFLIFFENMDDYVQNFGHFGHFVRIFGHILKKNQKLKNLFQRFVEAIEVPLDQISAF